MAYSDFNIPGIFTRVLDATEFVSPTVPLMVGMAGVATKGPFNESTDLVNISDFFRIFGPPTPDAQAYYAADAFFARGNLLRFIRVGGGTPAKALFTVAVGGGGSSPTLQAISEGVWGHDIDIYITLGSSGAGYVKIEVHYLGGMVETYDDLADDSDGAALITAINGVSAYIEAVAGVTGGTITVPQNGSFTGGDDGTAAAADFIGAISGNDRTGLKIFRNRREYPVNLLLCPDANAERTVMSELLDLAESRGDSFALIDAPDSLDGGGIVDWVNGNGYPGASWNTSFGANYWPWVKMHDDKNNQDVWTPPSGHAAGVYAYNDSAKWPWFAPAGMQRGIMSRAIETRMPLSDAEIEQVYANSRVNTLIRRGGVMINGSKTLLNASTALQYIEVRRGLLALRDLAERAIQNEQFDPNDDRTFRAITAAMQPILDFMKTERAFREVAFQCDGDTNPASSRRQHRVRGRFYVKPTVAAEIIILDLLLTAEGLSFSERVVETV